MQNEKTYEENSCDKSYGLDSYKKTETRDIIKLDSDEKQLKDARRQLEGLSVSVPVEKRDDAFWKKVDSIHKVIDRIRLARLVDAFRLAYTDVKPEELDNFREVYKKLNIPLLPAAEKFYMQYGGVFRYYYIDLDEHWYNQSIILLFYADVEDPTWPKAMENYFDGAMNEIDKVREFAGQEVCPVGDIGFYYPPMVYVGEDGRLYCVYEYQAEIEVFDTPMEIMADQLGNSMPVALKKYKNY